MIVVKRLLTPTLESSVRCPESSQRRTSRRQKLPVTRVARSDLLCPLPATLEDTPHGRLQSHETEDYRGSYLCKRGHQNTWRFLWSVRRRDPRRRVDARLGQRSTSWDLWWGEEVWVGNPFGRCRRECRREWCPAGCQAERWQDC